MSNYNPDTTLGKIKLDSVAYSAEKLSALINSGFVSKGKYNADKELTIQQVAPLSVVTLNKDTYDQLVKDYEIENDALYLVETDNIDAFQKTVSNVGNPIEANDAANKHYVDTAIQESAQTYNQYGSQTQKFSGVIFSDIQNPNNKYKLYVRNGKISLNLIV